jgi:hypothetical protein
MSVSIFELNTWANCGIDGRGEYSLWERLTMRRDDPSGGKMRLRTGHQSRGWRKR